MTFRIAPGAVAALVASLALAGCTTVHAPRRPPPHAAAPVTIGIAAINDFHGNLRPPPGGIRINDPEDRAKKVAVAAGGAVASAR